jgi:hypothetical protein
MFNRPINWQVNYLLKRIEKSQGYQAGPLYLKGWAAFLLRVRPNPLR